MTMNEELKDVTKSIENAEADVRILSKEISALNSIINHNLEGLEEVPEVKKLLTENMKLKHRLAVLKRAVDAEEIRSKERKLDTNRLPNIALILEDIFTLSIQKSFPDLENIPVLIAVSNNNPKFGDYQCNSSMAISQLYKAKDIKTSPRDIATKIVENTPQSPLIEKLEIAGPGFINIFLNRSFGVTCLTNILKNGLLPPEIDRKIRVMVDFPSPNIAKQMHVGHLRAAIIGESISRLLEYLGHDVYRVDHIGDWGTQFGMLVAHLQETFPDYLNVSPPIEDLQSFYKESKKRFDSDEEFKKRAYESVVKLQAYEPNCYKAWQLICDVSRKYNHQVYKRLGVRSEETGESFYQSRMEAIVKELEAAGYLEEDEGRKIMWGTDPRPTIPMTIVKSDGGFTYDTSDMAAIKYRLIERNMEWIIYTTDVGQATHFQVLKSCAQRAKIYDPEKHRIDHVGFGVVLGEDKKKFKTRSGETVRLSDLLDEGMKRSLDKLLEKGRDKELTPEELKAAQEAVAYGCIKYADLSHNRIHEYVFSFDKMLEDKGNTAVYLLYAYTRIKSIARNANLTPEQLKELSQKTSVSLAHEKEWKLGKVLLRFPEVLIKITKDLYLHHLCEYVYEIATTFTEFYDACYCIEKNTDGSIKIVHYDRILLSEITAQILAQSFYILGLTPVSRM
ncbi:probable arginine--tRNA ligase, cytoplasmic [Chrysoperla carnea]|uniref:probable arginine--tRNA ligase, cytoplasmic n=1 Tax=Chrysoperla carnea TaxID=189513 RepID=UPI001D085142|nr:probable arginine--tRNA ligase, cytoplasmic [Chrysoperla carnea]